MLYFHEIQLFVAKAKQNILQFESSVPAIPGNHSILVVAIKHGVFTASRAAAGRRAKQGPTNACSRPNGYKV